MTAINSGRIRHAKTLLERARERAEGDELRARIEASLAYVAAEIGDFDAAIALCDSALGHVQPGSETRGVVAGQRALLSMRRGETADALSSFDLAIRELSDPAELGKVHMNRGDVYLQQGHPHLAVADFEAAVAQLAAVSRPIDAAMARHNLGYAHFLRGDLLLAMDHMDSARQVLDGISPVVKAIGDQDRAEVLIAAGLVAEGQHALREASQAYASRHLHQRRGEAQLALARTLALTDPGAALSAARAARRLFTRTDSAAWLVRADAVVLACEVELGSTDPALVARGDALVEALLEQGLVWAAVLVRLNVARAVTRGGDLAEARRRLARVRAGSRAPLAVRLLGHDVRAEVEALAGRRGRALQHLRVGLRDLHSWQSTFGSLDLQTLVAGHGARVARRGLSIAVEGGRPDVLFEWSERARMLASRVAPVRAPADRTIAEDLAELRRLAPTATGPNAVSPHAVGPTAADERGAELRRRVREKDWQHRGSGQVSEPCRLDEVQAVLGDDTALVAYVGTVDRIVGLVVTGSSAEVVDLASRHQLGAVLGGLAPDLDMAASVDGLPAAVTRMVRAELGDRLDDLAGLLVHPVLRVLGERSLVITPSGMLSGVPWSLLDGLRGRPVTVAQSATSWLGRRTSPLRMDTAGFVAGPHVARAADEVRAAAGTWSSAHVLAGAAATASAVAGLASRSDVLHVAAHGRHSAANPMFSGLELVDGPWFGYDIDQLDSVPDVVLLSACEVGRSTVRYGEELIGMTAAWLHAGTRCVIASAAAVNDDVAHDVLVRVHHSLGAGQDPATALASAVGAVDGAAPPAPFVCFG
ncbi:CHAT domain-containing protein [Nocardioides sp.]|uniref:CHAT domain-containing protein n=1 Tax=Nocardioides sp. TaxID=35761 RepID=UPI0035614383